jgi:hypothetical protein
MMNMNNYNFVDYQLKNNPVEYLIQLDNLVGIEEQILMKKLLVEYLYYL